MSAKINLLPDVRQTKLQDKQRRQLAISITSAVLVVTAGLLLAGFLIVQGQNLRINQLTTSIKNKKAQVAAFPNVKEILSLQARTAALTPLYSQRVYMTKLAQIMSSQEPTDVDFTSVSLANGQLTIAAEGKSYLAAARVAKAITNVSKDGVNYFSNVQLSAVSLNGTKTTYSITATLNPGATSGN